MRAEEIIVLGLSGIGGIFALVAGLVLLIKSRSKSNLKKQIEAATARMSPPDPSPDDSPWGDVA